MAYYQEGLDGSGTASDPFLIKSYSDWKIIDARVGVGDPPPHYKLMTDLNMMAIKERWIGANFLGGTLDMDDHSIVSPYIAVDSYIIRHCNIIGGPLEVLTPSGTVRSVGGEGKIVNVKGDHIKSLLHKCYMERVYVDINDEGMWVEDSGETSLTGQLAGKQCYISIYNDGFNDKELIDCLPLSGQRSFTDCCFEFNGLTYDVPLIKQFYTSENPAEVILDHCLVTGSIDCSEMRYSYASTDVYIVDGGINSCAFDISAKGARDEQGYAGYAKFISAENGRSIAVKRDGLFVNNRSGHDHGPEPVLVIPDSDYRKPDVLAPQGFDVKKLR